MKILLSVFLFLIMTNAHAGTQKIPAEVTIENYRVQANGNRFAVTVNNNGITLNPASCLSSSSNSVFYIVNDGNSQADMTGYDQMFASIVSAKFNNAPIEIWIADDVCSSNLPVVELLRVN